jgi:peroxiredoxin
MSKIQKGLWLFIGLLFMQFTLAYHADLPKQATDISPLLIGEQVPEISITGLDNKPVLFTDVVKQKPTVAIFYRGGWCPYCNAHLSAVAQVEADIQKLGYQIVAISPDDSKHLSQTMDNRELHYKLYSDAEGELMQAMGIAFQAADRHKEKLLRYSGNKNEGFLPVPSLFIIDEKSTIEFEYISPDYKHRISADMLLGVLESLSK